MESPANKTFIDYDSEPVKYCSRCYSLKIKYVEAIHSDCCSVCGCTDTAETTIDKWEKLYEDRYGQKFVQPSGNPRNSPIFKLSISALKGLIFNKMPYKRIARALYPNFPLHLSKADSIVLLFDKISKDNKLDDLRFALINFLKTNKNGRDKEGTSGRNEANKKG